MTVVFHVLAGAAVAHAASAAIRPQEDGRMARPSVALVLAVGAVGVVSHGVLDGLKHGYPIPAVPSVLVSVLLAMLWVAAVRPPLALMFVVAIGGALLPDVIDLGADMARSHVGANLQVGPRWHVFPWHRRAGSGSMYPGDRDPARDLLSPENQLVSYTNHGIVVALSLACIGMSPGAFRFRRGRRRTTSSGACAAGSA